MPPRGNRRDAVGNRETQAKSILGLLTNDTYVYDDANRLTNLNGVTYTWDNNGNLKNDGVNAYEYDSANRLISFSGQGNNVTYSYSGLGDRLQETVNGNPTTFTMDLNAGLTQALSDGTKAYIYGNGRIAQVAGTSTEYFLGDALGSVRQMTQGSGTLTYAKAYDPYGTVTLTSGASSTAYGFTGEFTSNNLVYLRARHYAPGTGRFLTRDTWMGDYNRPLSFNRWMYGYGNPVKYTDPSGNDPGECGAIATAIVLGGLGPQDIPADILALLTAFGCALEGLVEQASTQTVVLATTYNEVEVALGEECGISLPGLLQTVGSQLFSLSPAPAHTHSNMRTATRKNSMQKLCHSQTVSLLK